MACDAVGRVVRFGGLGVTVPAPGEAAGVAALGTHSRGEEFQIQAARDGTVSYDLHEARSPSVAEPGIGASSQTLPACADGAYHTNDLQAYDTYEWWIGDGPMPGPLSRSQARSAFNNAIQNITRSHDSCGYTDRVSAKARFAGRTSYESDIRSDSTCTSRDHKSTWDAGNLAYGDLAVTCWWSLSYPGLNNELLEADTRYNIHDYGFTNRPAPGCRGHWDIRAVGTHEAGHVFGMGHVFTQRHRNLTMHRLILGPCKTRQRTLGKGDVVGLRSVY